jgi:hypothetical protein
MTDFHHEGAIQYTYSITGETLPVRKQGHADSRLCPGFAPGSLVHPRSPATWLRSHKKISRM